MWWLEGTSGRLHSNLTNFNMSLGCSGLCHYILNISKDRDFTNLSQHLFHCMPILILKNFFYYIQWNFSCYNLWPLPLCCMLLMRVWFRYLHAAQGAIGHHHSQARCWLMVSTLSTRTPVLCSVSSVLGTNIPRMHSPYPGCWSRLALLLSPKECHLLMPIRSLVVDHCCLLTFIVQPCAFSSRAVVCPSSPYHPFCKCGRQCYRSY